MLKREMEVRTADPDTGTITGIAVPYGAVIDVGGYRESFDRGAIDTVEETKLFYGHTEPIGRVTKGTDTDAGFLIEAQVSQTERGREVLTLMRDGVLNRLSVGFEPIEQETRDGVTVRTKVRLRECSVVAFPAYDDAEILTVRNLDNEETPETKDETMTNEETPDASAEIVRLAESLEMVERKVDALEIPAAPAAVQRCAYDTYGDFIRGAVAGDDEAGGLIRAYTGGTSADAIVQPAWIGDVVDIVNAPRKVLNAFNTATLPPTGLQVEYGKVAADTIDYQEQAAEGDVLVNGKISLEIATAPVKTFGGWFQMTRQEIERSNRVSILQTSFEAMLARYGKSTNDEVRAAVVAAIGEADSEVQSITAPDFADVGAVIGWVYDAAAALDVYAKTIDSLIVSGDVFKALATMVDGSNRPLLEYQPNGVNNVGRASVSSITATLLGIPVIVDPGAEAGTAWFVNSAAVLSMESPGAPFRLSQEEITALTKDFSVYGYMAVAVQQPHLIVASAAAGGFSTRTAPKAKK